MVVLVPFETNVFFKGCRNYQEIIHQLKPSVVLEFGTRFGGSTLFFADLLRNIYSSEKPYRILTVDIDSSNIDLQVQRLSVDAGWWCGCELVYAFLPHLARQPLCDGSRAGQVFKEPRVEVLTAPSASLRAAERLAAARLAAPGPLFAILDADHGKDNVTLELQVATPPSVRALMRTQQSAESRQMRVRAQGCARRVPIVPRKWAGRVGSSRPGPALVEI